MDHNVSVPTVNPVRGTCTVIIPIYTSDGRCGFGPRLELTYDSSNGNGPFGMGWSVPLPTITRRGVPRYDDSDLFVFRREQQGRSEASSAPYQELVPDGDRYRPRVESDFTLIQRTGPTWTTVSPDNVTSVYGPHIRHRERVFGWLVEQVRDDRGNTATYEYTSDGLPARIAYSDHFIVEFEYEDRPDAFSAYCSGFEIRTARRCVRIAMYHDFPAEFADGPNPRLVRSTELSYDDDPAGCHLLAVTQTGHLWENGGYVSQSLPPTTFGYTTARPGSIHTDVVEEPTHESLNIDWTDPQLRHVDLDGDGQTDLLLLSDDELRFHLRGSAGGYGPQQRSPIHLDEATVLVADMSGDGLADLVGVRNGAISYWPNLGHGRFGAKREMANAPLFDHPDLFDPDLLRLTDVDGTGTADLVYFGRDGIRFWCNQSGNSFSAEHQLTPGGDGRKSHLLCEVNNNLGTQTTVEYAEGLVSQVETRDLVSATTLVTSYRYHDGLVEQTDTLDGGTPVLTRSWFHRGDDPLNGQLLRTEVSAEGVPYVVTEHSYRVEPVAEHVYRNYPLATVTTRYDGNPDDPRVLHELSLDVDEFNTVLRSATIAYPRRSPERPEQARMLATLTEHEVRHICDATAYRLKVPLQTRTWELTGLPQGLVSPQDLAGAAKRPLTHHRIDYWDGPQALVRQRFELAFTETPDRASPALLTEGGYVRADGVWWIPSEVQHYNAMHMPYLTEGPFGNASFVEYDHYGLLPVTTHQSQTAPFDKLITKARNDYRLLTPSEVVDPNGNGSRTACDPLGRVIAAWSFGKEGEGDPVELPCVIFEYADNACPTWTRQRSREQHGDANSRWQESYSYYDGSGRIVLTKSRADDGNWVGSGRSAYDGKGRVIRRHESYFRDTHTFETAAPGVSHVMHHDPVGRLIRTDHPDGTFTRLVIGPWRQESWDEIDTVLDSLWYAERGSPRPEQDEPTDPDRRAAWLAARHAATPVVSYLDGLGRPIRVVADERSREAPGVQSVGGETHTGLDIEGNTLSVTDPRGILVEAQRFDHAGRVCQVSSADGGERWTLRDIYGTPIRSGDSRGHIVEQQFDLLRRPTRTWLTRPGGERILTEAIWYGESHPTALPRNLLGRKVFAVDGSGMSHAVQYDFKGNLLNGRRRLASHYVATPDWTALDGSQPHEVENHADKAGLLDTEVHPARTEFDALNRPTTNILPDGTIVTSGYGDDGRLDTVFADPIGPAPGELHVRGIEHDAHGRRNLIVFGDFLRTRYTYNNLSGRMTRWETFRSGSHEMLQDLHYTYDPLGNVTEIRDAVSAARFTYDALSQLVTATGREHNSEATKVGPYTEHYWYDDSRNLIRIEHVASHNSWIRTMATAEGSNRLADFGHDEHGNITGLSLAMAWDHADRLTKVDIIGGGTGYYSYDNAGQRVRKVLHRPGRTVEERVYLSGYEIHRRFVAGEEVFRQSTVHLGDLVLLELNDADVIVGYQLGSNPLEFHPYGTTALRLGKRHRDRDPETGLYYYGTRYYCPWLGRWINADYRYARNNPIGNVRGAP